MHLQFAEFRSQLLAFALELIQFALKRGRIDFGGALSLGVLVRLLELVLRERARVITHICGEGKGSHTHIHTRGEEKGSHKCGKEKGSH